MQASLIATLAVSILAFYVAWNLGANDVANSMGTSVGSKAVTLRQALIIAGILEFTGAVFLGRNVSQTLATGVVNPALFAPTPEIFLLGMVSVLIACGVWLQIATAFGLPVASSHATVGAIAGFGCLAAGLEAVDWRAIGLISLTWVVTPVISGAIAFVLYSAVKRWILDHPQPLAQLQEWIPWLSVALFGVFGIIVLPPLSAPLQVWLQNHWGLSLPAHDIPLILGAIAATSLTWFSWQPVTPRQNYFPLDSGQSSTLERQLARFQVLSACFVAFAHGSNDVGNAIAPLAAIVSIQNTGTVPLAGVEVPLWILILGGLGIVSGLAVLGKNVIQTIGENIIALQPSGGFCAELATATTILVASRLGLPVSTSHALVGGVIGVGLVTSWRSIQFKTVRDIGLAWIVTIPAAALLGAGCFAIARFGFAFLPR